MMEFHISRSAREKYQLEDTLFSFDGNLIFANFHAVRLFTHQMNAHRNLLTFPEQAVKSSQINAMGLIDEIFHFILMLYRQQRNPTVLPRAVAYLQQTLGFTHLDAVLEIFVVEYPPQSVFNKSISPLEYLTSETEGIPNRELLLEEFVMLWLSLENPALDNYKELFTEKRLLQDARFQKLTFEMQTFFSREPVFGPHDQSLLQMLRSPAIEVPDSITGQLEYIKENWSNLIGTFLYRLLTGLDLIKEENKLSLIGPGIIPIPVYDLASITLEGGAGFEPEAFSTDREWMPRLVLIAKNTYVWLDQLSQKYQTSITRLDQIPLVELETLAQWGITGLWLIGLWERSSASARIKQLCGNPDAISSAYSLNSYQIAQELGGERAYEVLKDNAARNGIRLASDMVPNHMGIDSDWVTNHPDWFLALDHSPYPSYTFTGKNLSSDPNLSVQIEDHYYDKTDAAVVFSRKDNRTGAVKFIYHGNDGTSMPWNDTAQINYLNPEVREAVIQTILNVAKKFPIIRFDAAMTLAKKHFQRLWFPQPGSGGAIPSRAEYGMSQEKFNRAMPLEFWRELVDRAAVEAPDTLLLAEAFWLMEGYFVRTLGMHRVYNSAFMNMLRNEDNSGYRSLIRNTLQFEPEILKRYVNFMNNPDERTAVEQFGKGDKYFGTCLLLATMPGLPMLGHGQIEGFSEKYGMEFRKAYWTEHVDEDLVKRHEQEIFPLLHQRRLFAGVDNFWLFDFHSTGVSVNENVYAYSNSGAGKSALILYNNNHQETEGWIHHSSSQSRKTSMGKHTTRTTIFQALSLESNRSAFIVFRDQINSLSYIRPVAEVIDHGFHFKLNGYEYHAFLDFQTVSSDSLHDYASLSSYLGEQGVPNIHQALEELILRPILEPFENLVNYDYLHYLVGKYSQSLSMVDQLDRREIADKMAHIVNAIAFKIGAVSGSQKTTESSVTLILSSLQLLTLESRVHLQSSKKLDKVLSFIRTPLHNHPAHFYTLLAWAMINGLGRLAGEKNFQYQSIAWFEEWQLVKPFIRLIGRCGADENTVRRAVLALRICTLKQDLFMRKPFSPLDQFLAGLLSDPDIQNFLNVNRHKDILWYNREAFDELTWWMLVIPLVNALADPLTDATRLAELILSTYDILENVKKIESKSGYRVDKLIQLSQKISKSSRA